MDKVQIVRVRPDALLPRRASAFAVGYDVYASRVLDKETKEVLSELPATIGPGESLLVGIGVAFAIPWPWEAQLRPRSGLANKYDIELSNSPGTIDPDFRGEAGALLRNRGEKSFIVDKGMRVAQIIFSVVKTPVFLETNALPSTIRGNGGFGSTGLYEIEEGTAEFWRRVAEEDVAYMRVVQDLARFPSAEGGACIIVKDGNIISTSHTLFGQKGISAEGKALSALLKVGSGVSTTGARAYLNVVPILSFASLIIACGIEEMVLPQGEYEREAIRFLEDNGLYIRYIKLP